MNNDDFLTYDEAKLEFLARVAPQIKGSPRRGLNRAVNLLTLLIQGVRPGDREFVPDYALKVWDDLDLDSYAIDIGSPDFKLLFNQNLAMEA